MRYLKPIVKGKPGLVFVFSPEDFELISGRWDLKDFQKLLKKKTDYAIVSKNFCKKKCKMCKKYMEFIKENKNNILLTIDEESIPYIVKGKVQPEYRLYIKNFINEVFNEIE